MPVIGSSGGSSGGGSSFSIAKPTYQTVEVTRTADSATKTTQETVVYTAAADSDKHLYTLIEFQNTSLQDAGNPLDTNFFNAATGDYFGPKGTAFNYPMTIKAKSSLLAYDGAPSSASSYLPTKSNVYASGTITTNGSYQTGIWSPSSNTTGVSTRLVDNDGKIVPYMYNGTTWQQWSKTVLLYPGDVITVTDSTPRSDLTSIDLSFKSKINSVGAISCSVVTDDGKILIGGTFTQYDDRVLSFPLVQLNSDGTIDENFHFTTTSYLSNPAYTFTKPTTNGAIRVNSIAIDSNGDILVGGEFVYTEISSGAARRGIMKIKKTSATNIADGSAGMIDPAFMVNNSGIDTSAANYRKYVNEVKIDADGKILLCGLFDYYNGAEKRGMVRLNSDGSTDSGFLGSGGGAMAGFAVPVTEVYSFGIDSSGKIWAVGNFGGWKNYTSSTGSTRNNMVHLYPTGEYTSFVPAAFGGGFPTKVTIMDDIAWISGNFITYNSSSAPYIVAFSGTAVHYATMPTSIVSAMTSDISAICTIPVQNPVVGFSRSKDLLFVSGGVIKRLYYSSSTSSYAVSTVGSYSGTFSNVTSLAVTSSDEKILFGTNLRFSTGTTHGSSISFGGLCKVGNDFYNSFYNKKMASFVLKITKVSSP